MSVLSGKRTYWCLFPTRSKSNESLYKTTCWLSEKSQARVLLKVHCISVFPSWEYLRGCQHRAAGQGQAGGGLGKTNEKSPSKNRKCNSIWFFLYTRYDGSLINFGRYLQFGQHLHHVFLWYPYINQVPKVIKF